MRAYLSFAQGILDGEKLPGQLVRFGGVELGDDTGPETLGGKGFGLATMAAGNFPVPPGFIISTRVCHLYQRNPERTMAAISDDLDGYLDHVRDQTGHKHPVVSVRSGAPVSMPGMMDTILNVGLTDDTLSYWAGKIGAKAAWDSRRRLYAMFAELVCGVAPRSLEIAMHNACALAGVKSPSEMTPNQLHGVCKRYRNLMHTAGHHMPETLKGQVLAAIRAVFDSWNGDRAVSYRQMNGISEDMGTAVVVQAMVFGNMNDDSATGVLFTRDPSTGAQCMRGELLVNAQGEDVVSGAVTPRAIATGSGDGLKPTTGPALSAPLNKALDTLFSLAGCLDNDAQDMQDIEFTIENGKLYLLQTRDGKRSGTAAFQIAHDQLLDGRWTPGEARDQLSLAQYRTATRPVLDATSKDLKPFTSGVIGSVGVAVGKAAFTLEQAQKFLSEGDAVIMVSNETTPNDIDFMAVSAGIVTATGGATSHAAVVARGMDKVCVTGCSDMTVTPTQASTPTHTIGYGDWLTVDGATGTVYFGRGALLPSNPATVEKVLTRLAEAEGLFLRSTTPGPRVWMPFAAMCTRQPVKEVTKLVAELPANERKGLILDLTLPEASPEDLAFVQVIGATIAGTPVSVMLEALAESVPNPGQLSVVLPDGYDASPLMSKFNLMTSAKTVAEALASKGPVLMSKELEAALGGVTGVALLQSGLKTLGNTLALPGLTLPQVAALLLE